MESGLVYMRHRMYDPTIGRFTQMDPILGNRPGEHYLYGRNNPASNVDPSGLTVEMKAGGAEFEKLLAEHDVAFDKKGSTYSLKAGTTPKAWGLKAEILWRMLRSPRTFTFSSKAVLDLDVALRESVVKAAQSVTYSFGVKYNGLSGSTEGILEGGDYASELQKWFGADAKDYTIGCWVGTDTAYLKGIHDALNPANTRPGRTRFNSMFSSGVINDMAKAVSSGSGHTHEFVEATDANIDDWVPGDMGYIRNDAEKHLAGRAGENLIYVGGSFKTGKDFLESKSFWGLAAGGSVRSLSDWHSYVDGWDKKARYTTKRQWANTEKIHADFNK